MKRLAVLLKSSRILYNIYYYVMSFLLKLLGLFVGMDDKLILFNSFGGKNYNDSPRAIYELMRKDPRFEGFRLVWAFADVNRDDIPSDMEVVKSDTFKFFVTALKARVWVTNSSMERGLNFKKRKTTCFNTWHGTTIKVMGVDIQSDNKSFRSHIIARADYMLAQGQYDVDIFSHAFKLKPEVFKLIGLPRNDILANYTDADVDEIKTKLNIDKDKKVILFAPTFREYSRDNTSGVVLDMPIDLKFWQEKLGDDYVVLFRAHYEVAKHMDLGGFPVFMDVSSYPSINDLMIISDALVSDYSSVFFDYSIMCKPMYSFAYDYYEYMKNRGTYIDLKDELPCRINTEEKDLIDELLAMDSDYEKKSAATKEFRDRYITEFGKASERSCDILYEELKVTK